MDLSRAVLASLAVIVVLGIGTVLVGMDENDDFDRDQFCQGIEDDFYEDPDTVGDLTCEDPESPEVGDVNVTGEVGDRTEVACVCVYEYEDVEEIITVSFPN